MLPSTFAVAELSAEEEAEAERRALEERLVANRSLERYERDLRELTERAHLTEEEVAFYRDTFRELCDEDRSLRRNSFLSAAPKLFGVPCRLLAGRLFDMVEEVSEALPRRGHGDLLPPAPPGEVGLLPWSALLEKAFGRHRERTQANRDFSFAMYDLNNDGTVSLDEALELSDEVERICSLAPQSESHPLLEEMRFLYGLVSDFDESGGKTGGLTVFSFKEVVPNPKVAELIDESLRTMAGSHPGGMTDSHEASLPHWCPPGGPSNPG